MGTYFSYSTGRNLCFQGTKKRAWHKFVPEAHVLCITPLIFSESPTGLAIWHPKDCIITALPLAFIHEHSVTKKTTGRHVNIRNWLTQERVRSAVAVH